MNTVSLIGRLTRDPRLKETKEGLKITDFTLAVSDYSSREDRADFLNITTFGKQAENVERYLRKGVLAGVSGRMRTDSYEDKDGIKRYPVSVIADRVQFLEWPTSSSKEEHSDDTSNTTSSVDADSTDSNEPSSDNIADASTEPNVLTDGLSDNIEESSTTDKKSGEGKMKKTNSSKK